MARTVTYKKTSAGTEYSLTSDGRPRLRKTNSNSPKAAPASVASSKKQIVNPKPTEDIAEEDQIHDLKPDGTLGDLGLDPFTARLELQNDQPHMSMTITGFWDDVYTEGHPYTKKINDRVEEILEVLNDCSEFDIDLGKSAKLMSAFVDLSAGRAETAVAYGKQVATVLLYLDYDVDNCGVVELENGMVEAVFYDVGFKHGSEYFAQEVPKAVQKAARAFDSQIYLPGELSMLQKLGKAKSEYDEEIRQEAEQLKRVEEEERKKADLEAALKAFGSGSPVAEGETEASPKDDQAPAGEVFSDDGDSLFGEKKNEKVQIQDRAVTSKRKVDDYLDGLPDEAGFANGYESSLPLKKAAKRSQHIDSGTPDQSSATKPAFRLALPPIVTQPLTNATPIQSQPDKAAVQREPVDQPHVSGEQEEQKGKESVDDHESGKSKETHGGKQRMKSRDQTWAANVSGTFERQFVKGKKGDLPIPFNEEVVAKQTDLGSAFASEQMRAWLQIHGQFDKEHRTKWDMEGQMEVLIAHGAFRNARNGDLFPSGYTSVKELLSPRPLETYSPYQDEEHDDRVLLALSGNHHRFFGTNVQSAGPNPGSYAEPESSQQVNANPVFGSAVPQVPAASTVPAQSGFATQTAFQRTQQGRSTSLVAQQPISVPIIPHRHDSEMRKHYGKPADPSRARAWFDPADVPDHAYTPGLDLELDMKMVAVDYGYSKDAVWSPRDNDDVTLRRVVTLVETGGYHVLTAGQMRGILRSFGQQHIRGHTKKDECRTMLLAAPEVARGRQILSRERQATQSQQADRAGLTVQQQQSLTRTQEVIDLTGEDDEEPEQIHSNVGQWGWTYPAESSRANAVSAPPERAQDTQPQPGWNQAPDLNTQDGMQSRPEQTWAIVPEQLPQYDPGHYGFGGL